MASRRCQKHGTAADATIATEKGLCSDVRVCSVEIEDGLTVDLRTEWNRPLVGQRDRSEQ